MAISLEACLQDLLNPDESLRRFAAEDLGSLRDATAAAPLAALLEDPSPAVREAVTDALVQIGGDAVVQAVMPALRSEDAPPRNAACEVLQRIGGPAVKRLQNLLDDDDQDVRLFAIDSLALIGSPAAAQAISRALGDLNLNVAAAAASALGEIRTQSVVPALVGALRANSWIRCAVARSLGQLGGRDAVRGLVSLLGDEDEMVVYSALVSLGEVGDAPALPEMFYLLDHGNPLLVSAAVTASEQVLARLGPEVSHSLRGRVALKSVLALAAQPGQPGRESALRLLGRLGDGEVAGQLAGVLATSLEAGDRQTQELICSVILQLGPADVAPFTRALEAAPAGRHACVLIDLLANLGRPEGLSAVAARMHDPDPAVRHSACRALALIGGEHSAAALERALNDADAGVRAQAANGMGLLAHPGGVPLLLPLLGDGDAAVREAAVKALGHCGATRAGDCVAEVARLLGDPAREVRHAATLTLASLNHEDGWRALESAARGATPEAAGILASLGGLAPHPRLAVILCGALSSDSAGCRVAALRALAEQQDTAGLRHVLKCLADDEAPVRRASVQYLARQAAGPWCGGLLESLNGDPDAAVRYECALALGRLRPVGALAALRHAAESEETLVLLGVIDGLTALGDPATADVLNLLAGHDDPEVCEAAVNALAQLSRSDSR